MTIPFHTLNPTLTQPEADALLEKYGARYIPAGSVTEHVSGPEETYHYSAYSGNSAVEVEYGDSAWFLTFNAEDQRMVAHSMAGPGPVRFNGMCVVVRGYKAERRTVEIGKKTCLPYVNGCSTRELIAAPRVGDPTLQFLTIPAYSKEQAHHIHSTVRVVYVLKGRGVSVVGMEGGSVSTELLPGMVCILDPMSPHHFETPQGENLHVIPFHVYSSGPGENNHPMFRGTFLTNQGE